MSIPGSTKLYLIILYVCICLTLILRINVESTGYMAPDSDFYIKAANNFLQGKGFVTPLTYPFEETANESFLTTWPVGYPAIVSLFSYVTRFDTYVSAKIINAIFLGFIFILLYRWYGKYSLLPACYFCSFGMLEVFSYTWSEGVFLFFQLWVFYLFEKVLSLKASYIHIALLIFALATMTLLRYAGLIFFLYFSFFIFILLFKKKFHRAKQLIIIVSVSSLIVFSYLLVNLSLTGGFFGGPRIFPDIESWPYFFKLLFDGLLNEAFIARNFYWAWDPLFTLLLVLQIAIGYYIFRKRSLLDFGYYRNVNFLTLISGGVFYLFLIIIIRKLSPFDAFNYRILAPFSVPVFIAILGNIRYRKVEDETNYINVVIVGFFIVSLIMNLPKVFILSFFGFI